MGRLLLRLFGWRLLGNPPNESKFIIIGAHHTTNVDGWYTILTLFALGLDGSWIGKDSLFKGFKGKFLRATGGIAVDRSRAADFVDQVANEFRERDSLVVAIAPEGTRKHVTEWKTGFYRIALAADVPICLCGIDYKRKVVSFGPAVKPTGDVKSDIRAIRQYYRQFTPKYPENYCLEGMAEKNTPSSQPPDQKL